MEELNQLQGAIFDLDGTLFDSLWLWKEIDRRFLARRGIELPADYAEAVSAMEFARAAEYTVRRFGLNEPPEALVAEWMAMAKDAYAREIPLKPGAAAYLRALAGRGVKLGIATSCAAELFGATLARHGVTDLFAAAVTTHEVGAGKEGPEVYLAAAQKLGLLPGRCAVFEDAKTGLLSAKRAGFWTVAVYDPHVPDWPGLRGAAHQSIRSFEELLGKA